MHLTLSRLDYLDTLLRAYWHARQCYDKADMLAAERELNKFGITIDYEENTP